MSERRLRRLDCGDHGSDERVGAHSRRGRRSRAGSLAMLTVCVKTGILESKEEYRAKPPRRSPMSACVGFGFPSLSRDSKKQGKLGSDAGAPRAALYSSMRKRGKPADGLRSPKRF
jgi:hypothetical protein